MVRDKGGPSDIECISDDVPRGENGYPGFPPSSSSSLFLAISSACVSTRGDGAHSLRILLGLLRPEVEDRIVDADPSR